MNITVFGTYDKSTAPRIQVLIEGLQVHGHSVNECNATLKFSTAERVEVLSSPWKLPKLLFLIGQCWLTLMLKRRHLPRSEAVIVGHLGQFDIHLAKVLFRSQLIILDYMISGQSTAKDRNISSRAKDRLLRLLDNSALKAADIIMVDTEENLQALDKKFRARGVVVHVGAPQAWFDAASKNPHLNKIQKNHPLRVIFFGKYTPLQGAAVIGQALEKLTFPVVAAMVGQGQDLKIAKQAAKNKADSTTIKWLDWIDADELPSVVATSDVCLGIFGDGPKALAVVPNKVYQGAAAGCAIITSDTAAQRRVLSDAALYVAPANASELARAIGNLAKDRDQLIKLRRAAAAQAQAHFTPEKIVMPLLETLNKNSP